MLMKVTIQFPQGDCVEYLGNVAINVETETEIQLGPKYVILLLVAKVCLNTASGLNWSNKEGEGECAGGRKGWEL